MEGPCSDDDDDDDDDDVQISKECGVPRFIHLSSVAADEQSESTWLRCKALGEKAVLDYYPNAAILRSNVIFGEEDKFLNNMAKWARIYRRLLKASTCCR